MSERMGTITVLRCAGCEAHKNRIAELEQQVHQLKFELFKLAVRHDCMKRGIMREIEGSDEDAYVERH